MDLQVLAAHGDTAASSQIDEWLAHDPEARRLWNTMVQTCQQVRPDGPDAWSP
ncbi:hypothetical protein PHK61_07275 [Actinomycetospora lutea]|uniref:hypothetical protein n=1 Tax=Actinomycetospora lutea TaxID=663604 RepID=UPI0023668DB0|nr:hypothetical protein [Actinomycetospora lutea]MDD7938216.1 hypothetical protein [Actinomycetospora lutea]